MAGVALPTFKLVKVPKLVMFGCAFVWSVPVILVDVKSVKFWPTPPTIDATPVLKVPAYIVCAGSWTVPSIISLPTAELPLFKTSCRLLPVTVTRSIMLWTVKFLVALPVLSTSVPKTKSFKLGVTVGYEYIIAIILVLKLLMMH